MKNTAADVAYKTLVAALGAATLYLATTFSVNLYRGISWHAAESAIAVTLLSWQFFDIACIITSTISTIKIATEVGEGKK